MESGKRILIVEDEIVSALALEKLLSRMGFVVVRIVATGEAAIESARTDRPDIVAMDIRLAGSMDGIDAASAIVANCQIPIVFMTGYDDSATRTRAMRLKPLGYMVKPISAKLIKEMMGAD